MSNQVISVIEPLDNPEYLKCMDYLLRRELGVVENGKIHLYTVKEYAERMGVSRQAIYNWIHRWEKEGLLRACREAMSTPLGEEVVVAKRRMLSAYPELLDEAKRIALKGEKDKDRLEAIIFLHEQIILPQIAQQPESGSEEANYIISREGQPQAFNPLALLEGANDTSSVPPMTPQSNA